MSADERMDARLREAGARWQGANSDLAAVDLTALDADVALVPITPDRPELGRSAWRPRGWIAAVAGVAAVGIAVLVAVSLHGGSGGHSRPAEGASTLVGRAWELVASAKGPVGASNATLTIDAHGHLTGSDGCNAIGGTVTIDGDHLIIGNVYSTAMGCLDARVNAVSAAVDAVVAGTVQWSIEGDVLTLTKPGAGTLTYRRASLPKQATDPRALTGFDWRLNSIEHGTGPDGTVSASSEYAKAVLRFDSSGHVTGNDTCNAIGGDTTISAGHLVFHGLGGTYLLCTGGTDRQILAVLNGSVTWSITGTELTITKPGVGKLVYDKVVTSQGSGTSVPAPTATN